MILHYRGEEQQVITAGEGSRPVGDGAHGHEDGDEGCGNNRGGYSSDNNVADERKQHDSNKRGRADQIKPPSPSREQIAHTLRQAIEAPLLITPPSQGGTPVEEHR